MHLRTRLRLAAIIMTAFSLLLIPVVASAYAPTGDDFITCTAGDESDVACVAGVFEEGCPGSFAAATEEGSVAEGSTTNADEDGEVEFGFDIPSDEGDMTVTVRCGTKVLSEVVENVNEDGGVDEDGETIADTGFDSMTLIAVAVGALALGGGVLAVSRRRGSADA